MGASTYRLLSDFTESGEECMSELTSLDYVVFLMLLVGRARLADGEGPG